MSTRPSRNAPPPPPAANALYCHTCGRIITPRKNPTTPSTPQKYCSDRCRRSKPRPDTNAIETMIERTFVRLLGEKKVVECGEVEREVFGRDERGVRDDGGAGNLEDKGLEMEDDEEDDDDNEGGGVPLPSLPSSLASASTTPATDAAKLGSRGKGLTSQQRGILKAREREMVRQAARRGVAFGFEIEGARRKVDCVRGGRVVESSFAKGEWGVRWRG